MKPRKNEEKRKILESDAKKMAFYLEKVKKVLKSNKK